MAFCTTCGAQVADGTAFCPTCGKPIAAAAQQAAPPPVAGGASAQSPTAGMQENVAGLLCYVLGWVTGIIFLLIDKRPFVRFHAAQSIVVFGAITVLYWIMAQFLYSLFLSGGWALFSLLFLLVRIGALIVWILLMVKAYQGERYRVPFAADFADSLAGKVKTV
jgi:uncharacterized membrane protein